MVALAIYAIPTTVEAGCALMNSRRSLRLLPTAEVFSVSSIRIMSCNAALSPCAGMNWVTCRLVFPCLTFTSCCVSRGSSASLRSAIFEITTWTCALLAAVFSCALVREALQGRTAIVPKIAHSHLLGFMFPPINLTNASDMSARLHASARAQGSKEGTNDQTWAKYMTEKVRTTSVFLCCFEQRRTVPASAGQPFLASHRLTVSSRTRP